MGTKIQINSKKALESLIDSDPIVEIEIKKGVINEIIKNSFKTFIQDEIIQNAITQLKEDFKKEFHRQIGKIKETTMNGWFFENLNDDVKKQIKDLVEKEILVIISKNIDISDIVKTQNEFILKSAIKNQKKEALYILKEEIKKLINKIEINDVED